MPICSICKKDDDNPIDYGEFMKKSDVCVHYYCLLLSTNLPQTGLDYSGILGFLLRDIRNEIRNAEERTCCYCKQPYASIACFKCKQYFHNICGNLNGCVSEFINEFHSYCHKHVPFGKEKRLAQQNTSTCWICDEPLGEYSPTLTLRSYCCKNGYVHRHCLRKYALAAGYHLKCIWCTSKAFRDDVRKHGVFVPDREASWDNNETLRYTDLHRGYSQCDAKVCHCPQGREFFRGPWKLMVCCMCGASGIHDKCGRDQISKNNYTCETCSEILSQSKKSKDRRKNANTAFNYTMFMSKTNEQAKDILEVENSSCEDQQHSEEETSTSNTMNRAKEPKSPKYSMIPLGQSSQRKPQVRELYIFGKTNEIVGTVQIQEDKLQQNSDKTLVCKEEDVLSFSTSDKLLKSIFSDIVAEGRELSVNMVDEVFDRLKLSLEYFGDQVD